MNNVSLLLTGICILPHYFTNWILLFSIINWYFNFPESTLSTVFILINLGFVGGMYITYVFPSTIYVPELDLVMYGLILQILDVFTHQIPFIYMSYYIFSQKRKINIDFTYAIIFGLIYTWFYNPLVMYQFELPDLIKIIILTVFLTYFITYFQKIEKVISSDYYTIQYGQYTIST